MSAFVTIVGRIISIEQSKNEEFTNITVNAPTGEKKKEGEQYAPSQRFRLGLSSKISGTIIARLGLEKGVRIMARGKLGYPYIYTTDSGDQGVIQNLTYDVSVERVWEDDAKGTSSRSDVASKSNETSAKANVAPTIDEDDIPF